MQKKLQSKSLYGASCNEAKYTDYQIHRHIGKKNKQRHVSYYRGIIALIEESGYTPKVIGRWRRELLPFAMVCMGTRNNWERDIFRYYLKTEKIASVDISPYSAADIVIDFNKFPSDWDNKISIIYSNSLDHAVDPTFTFNNWLKILKPGGLMVLGITDEDSDEKLTKADCSSFSEEFTIDFLDKHKDVELIRKAWVISGEGGKCNDPHYFIKKL